MTQIEMRTFLDLARRFRETPVVDDDFPLMRDRFDYALSDMTRRMNETISKSGGVFPEVVTLCGSTRFKDAYEREQARLTGEGVIVISVGRFGWIDGLDMDGELKKRLDELHLRKIDLSDRIHVINGRAMKCPGCDRFCTSVWCPECPRKINDSPVLPPYVGESTRREIDYAVRTGKKATYLNEVK